MKGIEMETPASLDLTRAAAFAIRLVARCSDLGCALVVIWRENTGHTECRERR